MSRESSITPVTALEDIFTENRLKIAAVGAHGSAHRNAVPHDKQHWGKVLVKFGGREHGYWVTPSALSFLKLAPEDVIKFISKKRRNRGVPLELPSSNCVLPLDFGLNLKLVREARALSQTALAERMSKLGCCVAQSTICYREKSKHSPGGRFLEMAAKALHVPPAMFFLPLEACDKLANIEEFVRSFSLELCGKDGGVPKV